MRVVMIVIVVVSMRIVIFDRIRGTSEPPGGRGPGIARKSFHHSEPRFVKSVVLIPLEEVDVTIGVLHGRIYRTRQAFQLPNVVIVRLPVDRAVLPKPVP